MNIAVYVFLALVALFVVFLAIALYYAAKIEMTLKDISACCFNLKHLLETISSKLTK